MDGGYGMKHVKNYLFSLVLTMGAGLLLSSVAYAQGITGVKNAASCLCWNLMQIIPIVSMLMIIGAGVVYAAGQIMGAETRARASQWGTAMLIGAVIGILIVTVAPTILKTMYGTGHAVDFAADPNTMCTQSSC